MNDSLLQDLRRLWHHMSSRRQWQFMLVLFLVFLGALAELATLGAILPFLALIADPKRAASYPQMQRLFAGVGWNDSSDILLPAAMLFAVIALCTGAMRVGIAWASQKFILRLGHDIATEIYRRTLYQPYRYHVSKNTSELIAATYKVQGVTMGVLMALMNAAASIVISMFILTALVIIEYKVALGVAFSLGSIYLMVTVLTRSRLRANSETIADAHVRRVRVTQEGLGGIRDVILDHAHRFYIQKFQTADLAYVDAQAGNIFIGVAPRYIIEAVGMAVIAALSLALSQGPGGLAIALPTLGALALGAQRLLPLIQLAYNGWTQAAGHRQLLTDVLVFMDLPLDPRLTRGEGGRPLPFTREIILDAVAFQYGPQQSLVLDHANLRIKKGERIALVGKTGSGKSTLLDIIMGLLEPTAGEIRVDGVPLTAEIFNDWQARIAHVPQNIFLSDASIAENIALAIDADGIDLARVREAARQAQIANFIEGLTTSYETTVGERGVRLSGGQLQRIGIARALYRRASLLVLDEATSALDNETEAAVMQAIRVLDRDLTILIVAHRLSTIEMCDRILEVREGRVFEQRRRTDVPSSELSGASLK